MADGFRRVPVEAKVTAGDRSISRYGHFLALTRGQQGAVVADAHVKAAGRGAGCPLAYLDEQGTFASPGAHS